ncbi:hypothetical protein PanWU01x14_090170 [Parasponia andersonii]|uniref:Uncharacterized protein n=1 Tax=Parasponia andersonii TaxID=3476 RepID=A0A2P5D7N4_PARAD|nr:hypothetical protein PanWU01x14_090170 [Parasponia andersonii]
MGKDGRNLSSWLEVAPAPIIYPQKPSNSPSLETIAEEAEEFDKESNIGRFSFDKESNIGRFSSPSLNFGSLKMKSCSRF